MWTRRFVFPTQDLGRARLLQIVESRRDGTQVHQQVIAMLERFEELQVEAAGCTRVRGLPPRDQDCGRRIGPALVFQRLWEECMDATSTRQTAFFDQR
jgi:hypothetical protein